MDGENDKEIQRRLRRKYQDIPWSQASCTSHSSM